MRPTQKWCQLQKMKTPQKMKMKLDLKKHEPNKTSWIPFQSSWNWNFISCFGLGYAKCQNGLLSWYYDRNQNIGYTFVRSCLFSPNPSFLSRQAMRLSLNIGWRVPIYLYMQINRNKNVLFLNHKSFAYFFGDLSI